LELLGFSQKTTEPDPVGSMLDGYPVKLIGIGKNDPIAE